VLFVKLLLAVLVRFVVVFHKNKGDTFIRLGDFGSCLDPQYKLKTQNNLQGFLFPSPTELKLQKKQQIKTTLVKYNIGLSFQSQRFSLFLILGEKTFFLWVPV
jgi:hypothetical protein